MKTRKFLLTLLFFLLMWTVIGCGDETNDKTGTEGISDPTEDVIDDPDTGEIPDINIIGNKDTADEDVEADIVEPPEDIVEPECTADEDCTTEEVCMVSVCTDGACTTTAAEDGTTCDDGNACTTGDACAEGTCAGGEATVCDDENGCTDDSCDPVSGCNYANNTAACDDGDFCSTEDTCAEGACAGTEVNKCSDSDPCTDDTCDGEAQACVNTPSSGAPCDDGEACTENDVCTDGACTAGASICPICSTDDDCAQDENLCNGKEVCSDNGFCVTDTTTVVICDEVAECSSNICQPETGECAVSVDADDTPCDDSNACTDGDSCLDGACIPGAASEDCIPGCNPTSTAGCEGCECETCVCDIDPFCCDNQWDASCVNLCVDDCGMQCEAPEPDPGCNTFSGPGCGGCGCEECVCALDSFCCESSWDITCASYCATNCGGNCGDGPDPGDCDAGYVPNCNGGCTLGSWLADGWCDSALNCEELNWDEGDCEPPCFPECTEKECGDDGCGGSCGICDIGSACYGVECLEHCGNDTCETELVSSASALIENCSTCAADCGDCAFSYGCDILEQPSCGGCACEECVCEGDSFCCDVTWDSDCVIACAFDCGGCDYSDGCFANVTTDDDGLETPAPGCDGCECEECVCALDANCCDVAWDASCAVKCQSDCGVPCDLDICTSDLDCFDGDSCTLESCNVELGVCEYGWSESCCQTDADCDDSDSCTVNTCGNKGQCQTTAAPGADCCPEDGDAFSTDFESDVPFTVDNSSESGGWQISQNNSHSETHSLWYGSKLTGDLNFGVSEGTLTSEAFVIPPSYSISLSYWRWAGQSSSVQARLVVGGETTNIGSSTTLNIEEWEEVVFNMTPYGGQSVVLEFFFSSTGGATGGVYIDDIAVVSDCVFPVCGDAECNGDENCFNCAEDCAYPETCPENDGCLPWEYPGCVDCECQEIVCADNPSCCDVAWDSACVVACDDTGIMDCGGGAGCNTSSDPGCGGCGCEACVCAIDSFCCANSWDSLCVGECKTDCGEWCPPEQCNADQVQDCSGGCKIASWIADGFCDSSLNCEETGWDGGDCPVGPPTP